MNVPAPPTPGRRVRTIRTRLGTDFGRVLERMTRSTEGAIAAVLSDEEGDAIDYAHDPQEVDELDVQLLAAQTGQSVLQLEVLYRARKFAGGSMLLETERQCLVTSAVADHYVLALLLERQANVARALSVFEDGRTQIARLL